MVKSCDTAQDRSRLDPQSRGAAVILALRQYLQGGGTGIDRYGAASPRFMGDLTWIGM